MIQKQIEKLNLIQKTFDFDITFLVYLFSSFKREENAKLLRWSKEIKRLVAIGRQMIAPSEQNVLCCTKTITCGIKQLYVATKLTTIGTTWSRCRCVSDYVKDEKKSFYHYE